MSEYDLNKVDKAEVKFDKYVTMLQVQYSYTRQQAKTEINKRVAEFEAELESSVTPVYLGRSSPLGDCNMDNAVHTNDTDKRSLLGLLTGLLFGALAGFGAMLLLAPQSGIKTRIQIEEKSIELQNRATDTYDDLVTLSNFDNRQILTGTQKLTENKHAGKAIDNLSNQASSTIKTEMQIMSEELLYNDSMGG